LYISSRAGFKPDAGHIWFIFKKDDDLWIGAMSEFSKSLDTMSNVFCLFPYCHRAVHHAEEPWAREILNKLADKRPVLDEFSLSIPELFSLYAVEEID
jgi:hypothetical protein